MDLLETDHWWFVAKRGFLRIALDKNFPNWKNSKILDVGCGTGAILDFLRENGAAAEGVDISPEALKYCEKKGLKVSLGPADKLPFSDGSFDIVIASDVLEHIKEPALAVNEIKRVLRPGGVFVATVPAHQFLFSYHDVALHHFRRYGKKDFGSLFSGFNSIDVSWIHFGILIPAFLKRVFWKKKQNGSDVQRSSKFVNRMMAFYYWFELRIFSAFGGMPAGLSLIAIAKK